MLARQTESLEKKILNFLNRIHRRNIRETLAAFAVIAIFAFDIAYGISQHREDNLSLVGGSIIILAMLLNVTIIRWKLHIPKSEISAFPPTQFPGKWKHRLTHQARMLRLVWLWYLLPLFLGISIYLLSVYDKSSISFIILFLFEIAAFIGAWRLNIQAAKQIERDRDTWFGVVG
ncbi:hypothetical protein H6G17_19880 [Chroococcidiopsis sp. FACHB-1243]|uniref:hypothetical protein n=1 Tax=Chroococcidiopsis sp. [FACHB-1243] TaxID=2692781 RepID=UPI0017808400|nr:hypothetical protein [Chroococcidiopsis sp. [FACHB-1243]]MBD2307731.1 hypothetical protein [Chroococcidiopsis sp. [FACHB-1243]]